METKVFMQNSIARFLLLASCSFAGCRMAYARDIRPQQAVDIARKYVALSCSDTITLLSDARAALSRSTGRRDNTPYYIFNDAHGRGFVVVAGDDAMGEVLAYGTEAPLDTLTANPCVKLLLDGYRQTFEALKTGRAVADVAPRAASLSHAVSPLLKSKWGQGHPFNAKTGYPYSGCVATAVAQIMYHYKWPEHGQGQNEYTVNYDNTTKSVDFSQSHYDWDNMLPSYLYPVQATEAQENAVALLMSDVGVASFMQYTPSSSGTQGISAYHALQKNFDYTAAYVTRASEGANRFAEILRRELLNGCPVYLEGHQAGSSNGHAWVADGFDENGLFHMNFGWEGQGDAYYSLTNLNVSDTGSEFGGKPLAFNRAITAILAHPNNGQYPAIDRGLLENSPKLTFNEGGRLTLKEVADKSFDPTAPLTVEMSGFVNRGKPFKGDVGVAVYNEDGSLQRVAYSADHAAGGFTQRVYGTYDGGFMGADYLVDDPQPVELSLDGLADGYYRLVPVCAVLDADGSWDEFLPMKKAPVIEVELSGGRGRVSEACHENACFQLMVQPRLIGSAEPGSKVKALFMVKNLSGVFRDCYLRVKLLDADRNAVLDARVTEPTEIEGFAETEIPVELSLPERMAPARYEVELALSGDEAETVVYPINNIHDSELAYIEVGKSQERSLMDKVEVFLSDDSGDKVESGSIDMSQLSLFKLGVALRTADGCSYEGPVAMYSEDIDSGERTQVKGFSNEAVVSSSSDQTLYSYWLRKSSIPWVDGHEYRLVVTGMIDNVETELKEPDALGVCLKREGDVLALCQSTATQIGSAPFGGVSFNVCRKGNALEVEGGGLTALRLYDVAGCRVRQAMAIGGSRAAVSLQGLRQGTYMLRVEAGKRHFTYKFRNFRQ